MKLDRISSDLSGEAHLLASMDAGCFRITHKAYKHGFAQSWHEHEYASIDFVLQGGGVGTYGGREVRSSAGRVEFFRGSLRHDFRSDAQGIRTMHVVIPEIMIHEHGTVRDVAVEELMHSRAVGLSVKVLGELMHPDRSSALAIESSVWALVDEVCAFSARRVGRAGWLGCVRDYLHAVSDRSVELGELADVAGVSRGHLARSFGSQLGMSAGEYHRRIRIAQAAQALSTSRRSVSNIARDTGFADQAHLTRVFGSAYGISPAKFRAALTD